MYQQAIEEQKEISRAKDWWPEYPDRAYALALIGRREEALKTRDEIVRNWKPATGNYYFALLEAGLGNTDEAFRWLGDAYQTRNPQLPYMAVDSRFDSLRSDPRFKDLLERMNLTQ